MFGPNTGSSRSHDYKLQQASLIRETKLRLKSEKQLKEKEKLDEELKSVLRYQNAEIEYLKELAKRRTRIVRAKDDSKTIRNIEVRDIGLQKGNLDEKAIDCDLTNYHRRSTNPYASTIDSTTQTGMENSQKSINNTFYAHEYHMKKRYSPPLLIKDNGVCVHLVGEPPPVHNPIITVKNTKKQYSLSPMRTISPLRSSGPKSSIDNRSTLNPDNESTDSFPHKRSSYLYQGITPRQTPERFLFRELTPNRSTHRRFENSKIEKMKEYHEHKVKTNFKPKFSMKKSLELESKKQKSEVSFKLSKFTKLKLSEIML